MTLRGRERLVSAVGDDVLAAVDSQPHNVHTLRCWRCLAACVAVACMMVAFVTDTVFHGCYKAIHRPLGSA